MKTDEKILVWVGLLVLGAVVANEWKVGRCASCKQVVSVLDYLRRETCPACEQIYRLLGT